MQFVDTYNLERLQNVGRQVEALRGLRFRSKGDLDAQFMVLTTEVTAHGKIDIIGICTGGLLDPDTGNMANGQVFRFSIGDICLTHDAIDKLEALLSRRRISQELRS
jgi:hypothetical protein